MLNDLAGMSEMLFKMPDKRSEDRGGAVCGDSNQGLSGSLPFSKGSAQCQQNGLPCDVFGKFYASSTSALCPTGRSPRRCAYPRADGPRQMIFGVLALAARIDDERVLSIERVPQHR